MSTILTLTRQDCPEPLKLIFFYFIFIFNIVSIAISSSPLKLAFFLSQTRALFIRCTSVLWICEMVSFLCLPLFLLRIYCCKSQAFYLSISLELMGYFIYCIINIKIYYLYVCIFTDIFIFQSTLQYRQYHSSLATDQSQRPEFGQKVRGKERDDLKERLRLYCTKYIISLGGGE